MSTQNQSCRGYRTMQTRKTRLERSPGLNRNIFSQHLDRGYRRQLRAAPSEFPVMIGNEPNKEASGAVCIASLATCNVCFCSAQYVTLH